MPDINSKEVLGALRGMKAITPTSVATKWNLKISVAKRMLTMMEEKGTIKLVTRSSNLKVYTVPLLDKLLQIFIVNVVGDSSFNWKLRNIKCLSH